MNGIKDSRNLSTNEQLAMFLYTVGYGTTSRSIYEHFQHSSETVSRYVHKVTEVLCAIKDMLIQMPTDVQDVDSYVRHSDKFFPFFKVRPVNERTLMAGYFPHLS